MNKRFSISFIIMAFMLILIPCIRVSATNNETDKSFIYTPGKKTITSSEKEKYIDGFNSVMIDSDGYMIKSNQMNFAFSTDNKINYSECFGKDAKLIYSLYIDKDGTYLRILEGNVYKVYHSDESDFGTGNENGKLSEKDMTYAGSASIDGNSYDVISSKLVFSDGSEDIFLFYKDYELYGYNYVIDMIETSDDVGKISEWDTKLPMDMKHIDREISYDELSDKMLEGLDKSGYFG